MVNSNMNTLGIIFPNSYDTFVPDLVNVRLMASIPFASRYRMIDFILSSMSNCGIDSIGVIVNNNYQSLIDHLGSGRAWDMVRKNGGLSIFPPYADKSSKPYRGRAGALANVLEFLKDSYVWIPCNAVMSEADMARFEQAMKDAGDDLSALVGEEFTTNDEVRLVPDILQNGDQFYFPVFSSEEEMGEYGEHFSKVQKHLLEVIPMARNNEKNVSGIVLNAFTEPFVLDAEIYDIVEKMKSRLE